MPRQQQQWSRGGGIPHQRSSHTVPPARQTQQQRLAGTTAQQQPSRGIPSIGVGGIHDCGSNALYVQEDSPPSPGAAMCAVYRCGRYGRNGHKSEHCATPRRFEGICGACGQYGHMWRNCALSNRQPHLNVFTSSGECYVSNAHGADTIVIPQQQANVVDLGGEDIPFQQPSDTMHYSIDMSGGGGGDGDALVPASLAAVGTTTMTTGTGVWRGSNSFTCNITAAWWRLVAHRGGGPEVTGRTEVAPFLELFQAVMTGLFTEVSSSCSLLAPSPPTRSLRCCPQSPLFSRTAARVLQSFSRTPVLSSMASLPRIASTTDGSRVRGSCIPCLVKASVRR